MTEQKIVRPFEEEDEEGLEEDEIERIVVRSVRDEVSGVEDRIEGAYAKIVPGVSGNAIQLDGYTSYIVRQELYAPVVLGAFSVEAWIALGAYPTHWCLVVDHSSLVDEGYFFGIDALGHTGFRIVADGERYENKSDERIPLRKWAHIAGVYTPKDGITLYVDGKPIASKKVEAEFTLILSVY